MNEQTEIDEIDAEEVVTEEIDAEDVVEEGADNPSESEGFEAETDEDSVDDDDVEGELVISIDGKDIDADDGEEVEAAPTWVKDLRKSAKELKRENRDLRKQIEAQTKPAETQVQLGEKPTLEAMDYDEDKYAQSLQDWMAQKAKVDQAQKDKQAEQEKQTQAWNDRLSSYDDGKAKLRVKDFDDAEDTVKETLSQTQQGILIQGSNNPALLVYVLGKNAEKAKELASITDPVQFAFAAARLESSMKTTRRKPATAPEKRVPGSTGGVSGGDKTLEKLEAEAEKTGDRSKILAYKRQLKTQK